MSTVPGKHDLIPSTNASWLVYIVSLIFISFVTIQVMLSSSNTIRQLALLQLPDQHELPGILPDLTNQSALFELVNALDTLQSRFFDLWLGGWPDASQWTAAVFSTYISATLRSLTMSLDYSVNGRGAGLYESQIGPGALENSINRYFSQVTSYYYNEDALAIRTEAHDDMLWVVLEWLESVKFMNLHNSRHHNSSMASGISPLSTTWQGKQFQPVFAHRSHVFYDIVYRAWDTKLCGGGLTWDPKLEPYKNTVTNTQYITASVGMYLYHPGDDNQMPFFENNDGFGLPKIGPHEKKFLDAAIEAYDWLVNINLTDANGLYVDGYHISGNNGSICDERNEMVYTYNQGILLSGLRGLWEGTGRLNYLEDGHGLVHNVIHATGWTSRDSKAHLALGRDGIIEEHCDPSGTCSQDEQNFKGIFFHHLTLFCEPLPTEEALIPGTTFLATKDEALVHAQRCRTYLSWVAHNAHAALRTRDEDGVFGGWWGAGLIDEIDSSLEAQLMQQTTVRYNMVERQKDPTQARDASTRGRTVETQSGGVALLRALYELSRLYT